MLWKAGLARTNNLPRTAVTARYTTSQCLAHHSFTGLAETFPSRTARATLTVTVLAPRLCPGSLEYSFPVPVSLSLPVPPPLSPLPLSLFFLFTGIDPRSPQSVPLSCPCLLFSSVSPLLFHGDRFLARLSAHTSWSTLPLLHPRRHRQISTPTPN